MENFRILFKVINLHKINQLIIKNTHTYLSKHTNKKYMYTFVIHTHLQVIMEIHTRNNVTLRFCYKTNEQLSFIKT